MPGQPAVTSSLAAGRCGLTTRESSGRAAHGLGVGGDLDPAVADAGPRLRICPDRRGDLGARAPGEVDDVPGVAVGDLVLLELVLIVDGDGPVEPAKTSRSRSTARIVGPSHVGTVVMST